MAIAGMAYGYDQYKKDCPNWSAIESTQTQAQEAKLGVWKLQSGGQRPWDYRKSNPGLTQLAQSASSDRRGKVAF